METTISTKQKVKQSAQKLFRERGYAAIGMRELAKAVGIQAPSLYNHYKSKDDLLREICFDMAHRFFNAFGGAVIKEKLFSNKLKEAIKAHIDVIASNPEAAEVFFNEWMFLEQPYLLEFKKMRLEYEMKFRNIIEKGITNGEFKNVNSKLAAFVIFSTLNATYELYSTKEKILQEQMDEDIAQLLLKGIKS